MLVLSRKKDETIILKNGNKEIKVTIINIDNKNKVRIGIEADPDIKILRSELSYKEFKTL